MILGINASRARSGGAKAHLVGLLTESDPREFGFSRVYVWCDPDLQRVLPPLSWLTKESAVVASTSIASQLFWERYRLPTLLKERNCSVLFNVDAGSVCQYRPMVTMSQDMLSYEPGEMERYGLSRNRFRLLALRYIQNASLRASHGVIFLTKYAATVIQRACGRLNTIAHIPHGVGEQFRDVRLHLNHTEFGRRPIVCLYVSNTAPYKHQIHVVTAFAAMRRRGCDVNLKLVGGGIGPYHEKLIKQISILDPDGRFVVLKDFVSHNDVPALLATADIFVFASSCENMPVTLLEAMAAGLPIACSNRGPMPEVLEDGGVFFDPEDPRSIEEAVARIVSDDSLRNAISAKSKKISARYSWERCSRDTFSFLARIAST